MTDLTPSSNTQTHTHVPVTSSNNTSVSDITANSCSMTSPNSALRPMSDPLAPPLNKQQHFSTETDSTAGEQDTTFEDATEDQAELKTLKTGLEQWAKGSNTGDHKEVTQRILTVYQYKEESLDLSGLDIKSLPSDIVKLPWLRSLDISNNQLSSLPDAVFTFKNLTKLNCSNNKLKDISENIKNLNNLTSLDLSGNKLNDLPANITDQKNLTKLDISNNVFEKIPLNILSMKKLTTLKLSNNQISTVPSQITQLALLKILDLSKNKLTKLPSGLEQCRNLSEVDISFNPKIHQLPGSFERMFSLESLKTEKTGIPNKDVTTILDACKKNKASLKSQIAEWQDYAKHKNLTEQPKYTTAPNSTENALLTKVPQPQSAAYQLVNTKNPQTADISRQGNALQKEQQQLEILKEDLALWVLNEDNRTGYNGFVASLILSAYQHPEKITHLNLPGFGLTSLPESIGMLENLTFVNLSGNQLRNLPTGFEKLKNLSFLDLSNNQIRTVPSELFTIKALRTLNLNNNSLERLPTDLKKMTGLTTLDLSGNRLTELSKELLQLTHLEELNVSHNRLETLPEKELENLAVLKKLGLSNNRLSELPTRLGACDRLKILDISNNTDIEWLPDSVKAIDGLTVNTEGTKISGSPPSLPNKAISKL